MKLCQAAPKDLDAVRDFYWNTIDLMQGRSDTVGWIKGVYPSEELLRESLSRGELYVLPGQTGYDAAVVLNSRWNAGYEGLSWAVDCSADEVLVPHALAVFPPLQRRGIGREVVADILEIARRQQKKAVRLDILAGNLAAERLYTSMGFSFAAAKELFYEDTGLTLFRLYEFPIYEAKMEVLP